jgi:hypothetical protein
MSRHKAMQESTIVIGSSPVLDYNPKSRRVEPVIAERTMRTVGHGDVPYMRQGQEVWRKPKPAKLVQHFRNEAARRRCNNDLRIATPADLKLVPIYDGCSARLANEIMYAIRRNKRKDEERKARLSLMDRAKEALGITRGE